MNESEIISKLTKYKTQILELTEFSKENVRELKMVQNNIGILLDEQRDKENYGLLSRLFMGAMGNKKLLKSAVVKDDYRIYQSCIDDMLSQIKETTNILNTP